LLFNRVDKYDLLQGTMGGYRCCSATYVNVFARLTEIYFPEADVMIYFRGITYFLQNSNFSLSCGGEKEMVYAKLEKWLERYNENGYLNGTLLIAAEDKILVNSGFGMANWEHQVPNSASTKFRIGSLSKAFTALSIFQLHEQGKLNIDDFIGKYLSGYPNGDKITIYHGLTNTSGIPNYTSFPDFWSTTMRLPKTLDEIIDHFKNLPLNFEPGSKFEYSNSGYALLTAIIEKVSDKPYAEYIRENICLPLGMQNTGCDDGINIVSNLASGYSYWEKPIHAPYADLTFPLGAYGLYSTTEDLFLWDQALKSSRLLGKESTEKMFIAYKNAYACGWVISKIMGRKCSHHFGDISGYVSEFFRFADDGVTIIFLSNMNVTPVTHLTNEIAKIMFAHDVILPASLANPIPFAEKELLQGKYEIEGKGECLDISMQHDDLYLTVSKMYGALYKFKLVPIRRTQNNVTFQTEMIDEQLIFHFSSSGKVEFVEYKDYHHNKYIANKKQFQISG